MKKLKAITFKDVFLISLGTAIIVNQAFLVKTAQIPVLAIGFFILGLSPALKLDAAGLGFREMISLLLQQPPAPPPPSPLPAENQEGGQQ